MPAVLGVDLGTTTITAVALDAETGKVLGVCTRPNDAEITAAADSARGFSEWDADRIMETARRCLREVGSQCPAVAGIGITGQQHGVILRTNASGARNVLINWQDRRGEELYPDSTQTYVQRAVELAGLEAQVRNGCRLATGFLGVTLFWLRQQQQLPAPVRACFLPDYCASVLTATQPVTDPTCAASSGIFDVTRNDWDNATLDALGLERSWLPPLTNSGDYLAGLAAEPAKALDLPAGVPVFVGIGDNQASFLGSVAWPNDSVLINVGTGGQVATYVDQFLFDWRLETRPFPRGGYLLVSAGLCGGRAYALLEQFFREVGKQLLGVAPGEPLFQAMNRLAAAVPSRADGLCCAPFFAGTRAQPELRAFWGGISAMNFTPGHLVRSMLEGMAQTFVAGYRDMVRITGRERGRLVGAGNGLRENAVLANILAEAMRMPVEVPVHREEAACGAALVAAVGAGIQPDLLSAGRVICYETVQNAV